MGEPALSDSASPVKAFASQYLARPSKQQSTGEEAHPQPVDSGIHNLDWLLDRMRRSKSWGEISRLIQERPAEEADRSSRDMRLCNYLAFYSDNDAGLIDAAFRQSALFRPKWDERHSSDGRTYGELCIEKAIAGTPSTATDGSATAHKATSHPAPPDSRRRTFELIDVRDALRNGPPPLDPVLIDGLLREGQKMLISAPPKVGKSWLAIDLASALATGAPWLCFNCARCSVVYANLEISGKSFLNRTYKVLGGRGFDYNDRDGSEPFLAMEGRGMNLDAEQFVDGMINTWQDAGSPKWGCVIVDCLYQLETGDENAVKDMRPMVGQLDRLGRVIGCALVVIHHHSKGAAGGKASIDRAAGSSVFSRWPDALIDISPLDSEGAEDNDAYSEACRKACHDIGERGGRAYRMSFDLREFPTGKPIDLFSIGGHFVQDSSGALAELPVVGSAEAGGRRGGATMRQRGEQQRKSRNALIEQCIEECKSADEPPTVQNVFRRYKAAASDAGLPAVQRGTFQSWLKPSNPTPFHLEGTPEGSVIVPGAEAEVKTDTEAGNDSDSEADTKGEADAQD